MMDYILKNLVPNATNFMNRRWLPTSVVILHRRTLISLKYRVIIGIVILAKLRNCKSPKSPLPDQIT